MRKLSSKILSSLLAVVMLISTAQAIVFAEDATSEPSFAKTEYDVSIVNIDFSSQDYASVTTLTKSTGDYDTTNTFYVKKNLNIITKDGRKAVDSPRTGGYNGRFGISSRLLKNDARYYNATTKSAAKLVKLEYGVLYSVVNDTPQTASLVLNPADSTGFKNKTLINTGNGIVMNDASAGNVTVKTNLDGDSSSETFAPKWRDYTVYFDFENLKYSLYYKQDGEDIFVATKTLPAEAANGFWEFVFETTGVTSCYISHMKLSIASALELTETDIQDGAEVNPDLSSYTATFNKNIGEVTDALIDITSADGGTVPAYSVTKSGNAITINFVNDFTPGKTYSIKFKSGIKDQSGRLTLGQDVTKTFTTATVGQDLSNDGFDTTMVDIDFGRDGYESGNTLKKSSKGYYDSTETFYLAKDQSITSKEGRVAVEAARSSAYNGRFGISSKLLQTEAKYYNTATSSAPKLVKLEYGVLYTKGQTVDLILNPLETDQTKFFNQRKVFIQVGNGILMYDSDQSQLVTKKSLLDGSTSSATFAPTWRNYTVYFDFEGLKYSLYYEKDGEDILVDTMGLPEDAKTGFWEFALSTSNTGSCYISHMKLSTVSAYGEANIAEYSLPTGKEMAFAYDNETAAEKTIKVIKAKYDSENVLVSTVVENIPVAATTSVLHKLDYPSGAIPSGGYVKYFVWDGFDTMKPVTNSKTFR